jgi:hypothetical protein
LIIENEDQVCDEYEMYILFTEDSFFIDINQFKTIVDFEIPNEAQADSYKMRRKKRKIWKFKHKPEISSRIFHKIPYYYKLKCSASKEIAVLADKGVATNGNFRQPF